MVGREGERKRERSREIIFLARHPSGNSSDIKLADYDW
jgi:hypothetical protein